MSRIRLGRATYYEHGGRRPLRTRHSDQESFVPEALRVRSWEMPDALHAWQTGGSMGLGLWLAGRREKIVGDRYITTAEYDAVIAMVLEIEDGVS